MENKVAIHFTNIEKSIFSPHRDHLFNNNIKKKIVLVLTNSDHRAGQSNIRNNKKFILFFHRYLLNNAVLFYIIVQYSTLAISLSEAGLLPLCPVLSLQGPSSLSFLGEEHFPF